MVNAEPGKTVKLKVELIQKAEDFRILANCILFTLLCTDSNTNQRLAPIHAIRLPNLRYRSLE